MSVTRAAGDKFHHSFGSRPRVGARSTMPPPPDEASVTDTGGSRQMTLRVNEKFSLTGASTGTVVKVHVGELLLEIMPKGGRRQLLDFLVRGDLLPLSVIRAKNICLRARTDVRLQVDAATPDNERDEILKHFERHLARRNLHQLIVGQLGGEQRVASFLVMRALVAGGLVPGRLEIPMSRDDIADYLSLNPDTLSRIMARFADDGILVRESRRVIHLIDTDKLARLCPFLSQIANMDVRMTS